MSEARMTIKNSGNPISKGGSAVFPCRNAPIHR